MSQGTLNLSPLQQSGVHVGYDATDEHSIHVWPQDLTAVPFGQPASPQDILLPPYPPPPYPPPPYLTDPEISSTSHAISSMHSLITAYPAMMEDQDDLDVDFSCYLNQELVDNKPADVTDQYHLPFDGNEHPQLSNSQDLLPLRIPADGAAGPLTSSTGTDPSPQTPLKPYVAGHFPSQESPGIKLPDITDQILLPFDGDEHSQPDDVLPADVVALLFAPWNINDPSTQSPVGPSASWPPVIKVDDVEDYLVKSVGSTQIQQAANKRRNKDGIHQCPFRNARKAKCDATFTARHNLRYHIFAHLGLKPYKCNKCKYAASSPATNKRHQSTCKGTTEGNAIDITYDT